MFFRWKKKKEENLGHIEMMQKMKSALLLLEQYYEAASRLPVQKSIKGICRSTRMILKELAAKPVHGEKLAMFADYYLPETAAIAGQYLQLNKNRLQSEKSELLADEIERFFPYAETAFVQILESLALPDARSISTDIDLLITELKKKEQAKQPEGE